MPDDGPELSTTALGSASPALGHTSRHWLGWSLALGVIAGCLLCLDVHDVPAVVRHMRAHDVAFVLALLTGDRVLMALKWRLLLGLGGAHLSAFSVIRIYYQGWLVGAVLPSHLGGDLLRAYLVARRTGVGPPVFASLVMEKLMGLVSAVNWAIVGGVIVARSLDAEHGALWLGLSALAALACNGLFLVSLHDGVHAVALGRLVRARQSRCIGMLHRCYAAYAGFSRRPETLLATFGLTVLEHGLQLLILFTIATSLGIAIEPVRFAAAAAIQMLMVRLPIAPDGWGTGELAAIALFGLIGISAAAAFTISVVSHVLGLVAALPAFVCLVFARERPYWSAAACQSPPSPEYPAARRGRLSMDLGSVQETCNNRTPEDR